MTGTDILKAQVAQAERRAEMAVQVAAKREQQVMYWQAVVGWLMRKHGETSICVPSSEHNDVVRTSGIKVAFVKVVPEGGGPEEGAMTVDLMTREDIEARAAQQEAAKPILKLVPR